MSNEPSTEWEILDERVVYEHPPWLKLVEQDIRLPNGIIIEKYVLTETPDVAMVFAITESGKTIFVEQYKHGMGGLSLDLSDGYMDDDDPSPLAAAQRELEEETGYVSDHWTYMASLVINPNRSNAKIHYYLARGCRPCGTQHLDPTEDLRVHLISMANVRELIASGRVTTMSSAAGIALGLQTSL